MKRQTDNTTPGGMGLDQRGLVPSSHKRSKFGADWRRGRVVDFGPRGPGFDPQPGRLLLWP